MFTKKDIVVHTEETVYTGFSSITRQTIDYPAFNGGMNCMVERESIQRPAVVGVLPYDSKKDCVVLVEQFRIGALADTKTPWLSEIVAGLIDPGEDADRAAHRELKEETGLVAQKMHHIQDYWVSPGMSTERVSLYCAHVDSTHAIAYAGMENEQEDIKVHVVPYDKVNTWLLSGQVNNSLTLIALQWLVIQKTGHM